MSNDADQKPKWREYYIPRNYQNEFHSGIHVIEAAPALAEIESLRVENAELIEKCIQYREGCEHVSFKMGKLNCDLQTKLSAATAQMEKMAETLTFYASKRHPVYQTEAHEALAQYEQFKKDTK